MSGLIINNFIDPQLSAGAVSSTQQTRFEESLREYYRTTAPTVLNLPIMSRKIDTSPGDSSYTEVIRGGRVGQRGPKAAGDLPNELSYGSHALQWTYDPSEYGSLPYDNERSGDARYQMMSSDIRSELDKVLADRATRLMHTLARGATLAGIPGFMNAPVIEERGTSSADPTTVYTKNNAGAELLFEDLTDLRRKMQDRENNRGNRFLWLFRHDVFDTLRYGTRTSSNDFNSVADMAKPWTMEWDGDPIVKINSQFWPSTNYVDPSFPGRYNHNALFSGANGMPVAFYINYGSDRESPLAEIVPPSYGTGNSAEVTLESDRVRNQTIAIVRTRATYDVYDRGSIGVLRLRQGA